MIDAFKKLNAYADENHPKKAKLARYIISGGMAAVADLGLLYIFTDICKIWYVISVVLAFLGAFMVSFTMQKYWTFKSVSNDNLHSQAISYFIVTGINLGLNTLGVFLFVQYGGFHYMIAQIVVSALIAVESYFVYHYIFK